jgi:hypothetical protein
MIIPELSLSEVERFLEKVSIKDKDACWEWMASKRRRGYGRFCITRNGKDAFFVAPRVSYFIYYKKDPGDKVVLHSCDNPSCVNPFHLAIGTNKDNSIDMMKKGRGLNQFEKGSSHKNSKLTESDILNIRKSSLLGTTQKELAKTYKVDPALISRIINRKLWCHI